MSKSKIFAGALGVATVLTLGVAVMTASAQTTFTSNLTVGSTGAQVTALQQILASKGFLTVAPTGYFGSLTKAAVAAWQASVGLPSTGFFGPMSRAAIGGSVTTTTTTTTNTPGCPAGALFNSMTAAPCVGTSTVPGCVPGALFSSTTAAPCGTTTTTTTTTGTATSCPVGYTCTPAVSSSSTSNEGTLTLTLSGTPSNQTNIQQNIDVPVWGLQAQAQIGDVSVQRLDLDVADTVNAGSPYIENPGNFINNIKLWDGSTVLGSWNVNTGNFVQGTTSSDYYIRLSGFNFSVPNGQTKVMTVSFSTNGGIDTSRTLVINGFGSTGLQTTSAGVTDYYDIRGGTYSTTFARNQTFTKPGNTTVTFGIDSSNPLSQSTYVDTNTGAQNVPVLVFNAQATNANAQIQSITVQPTLVATGDAVAASTVTLVQNGTAIASQSLSGNNPVTFNNLNNVTVASGTTQPYVLEVSVPAFDTTNKGVGTSTVTLAVTGVTYQSTTGQIYNASPSLTGNAQYFFTATPQLAFVTGSASLSGGSYSGQATTVNGQITVTVTPKGGQMVQPVASDFTVGLGTSLANAKTHLATSTLSITSITPQPSSSSAPLSTGQTYTIVINATANSVTSASILPTSGLTYQFYLVGASTTVQNPIGGNVSSVQTWGLDNFKSGAITPTF